MERISWKDGMTNEVMLERIESQMRVYLEDKVTNEEILGRVGEKRRVVDIIKDKKKEKLVGSLLIANTR